MGDVFSGGTYESRIFIFTNSDLFITIWDYCKAVRTRLSEVSNYGFRGSRVVWSWILHGLHHALEDNAVR